MNDNQENLKLQLEAFSIQELRSRATKQFGIKLSREHTKPDIIDLILEATSNAEFAEIVTDDKALKPGWARIHVHPVNGRKPFPFYVNCNGYEVFIPFNVPVDVPRKLIALLKDAEEYRITADEQGNEQKSFELSYPFTIIQDIPGPDPRPGLEVQREIRLKPKRRFQEKFGYWPTDKALADFRNGSLVPDNDID